MSCQTRSRPEALVSGGGAGESSTNNNNNRAKQEPPGQTEASSCNHSSQIPSAKSPDCTTALQESESEPEQRTVQEDESPPQLDPKRETKPDIFTPTNDVGDSVQQPGDVTELGQTLDEHAKEVDYFKPYGPDDNCDLNPEFAIICSFIAHFGEKIDLELNIEELKSSLEAQDQLDNRLVDLHVKLLKKLRRYFVRDQWEKALIRFASEYSYEDAYELEQLGYLKTRPSIKMQLLRRLLDAQFECDQKFKAAINTCEADELRLQPMGRDIKGNTYWQRADSEGNFRIFQEQPMNYKSWKAICSKPEELQYLIDELEATKFDKIKGDPMTEPYNPLPEIFTELFVEEDKTQENEEKLAETKKPTNSRAKRGRKGQRGKKNSLLTSVKEEGEDESNQTTDLLKRDSSVKQETKPIIIPTQKPNDDLLTNASTTIESQVRNTLENLISRVVSSIDYLKWPLSLGTQVDIKEEPNLYDIKYDKIEEKTDKKPKKRASKKNKPEEEILPRRSSSRIQQLQQKKVAEEEEKVKKMIEISASSKPNFVPEPDDTSRSRSVSSRNARQRSGSPEEEPKPGRRRRKGSKTWCRGKNKKKLSWDQDDSDLSSTSSVTESNDEEFVEEIEEQFKFDNTNLDDEFACEDEDTNVEPVIVKRARTARQSVATENIDGDITNNSISIIEEDKPCGRCDKSDDPENILLCDTCDDGWHTFCCLPPLMVVPDGDWFCPPCEHNTLLGKLKELFGTITEILAERERERIKRQRLRQNAPKREPKLVQEDLLPDKRPKDVLPQLNDPIALQDLDNELEESEGEESSGSYDRRARGRGRKKAAYRKKSASRRKVSNFIDEEEEFRVNYRKKNRRSYSKMQRDSDSDESESEETHSEPSEESEEEEVLRPKARRARNCVSYRFQEYDELIASAIQAETNGGKQEGDNEYDDEEQAEAGSDDEDEPQNSHYGRGKDMATIEALAYQQENGLTDQPLVPPPHVDEDSDDGQKKRKKKARRLNDLDGSGTEEADSDESFQASSATEVDEEDEDEDVTEEDSDASSIDELIDLRGSRRSKSYKKSKKKKKRRSSYESDDSDFKPRTTRRAATKQVSYRESSDDDDFEFQEKAKKVKRNNVLDSETEESNASWKSQPKLTIQDDDDDRTQSTVTSRAASPGEAKAAEVDSNVMSPEGSKSLDLPEPESSTQIKSKAKKRPAKTKKTVSGLKKSKKLSIDEITLAPTNSTDIASGVPQQRPSSPTGIRHLQHGSSTVTIIPPDVRDPMEELNQYCKDSSNNPTTMFNSYNETLSRSRAAADSPPPPAFYPEDEPEPTSSNGQPKKSKKAKHPPKSKTPPQVRPDKSSIPPPPAAAMLPGQPQRYDQALPSRQTRPLVPTPPNYHAARNMQQPRMYPIQGQPPLPGGYIRGPLPNKYAIPPPSQPPILQPAQSIPGGRAVPPQSSNQMHSIYPLAQSPYGGPLPPLPPMQQSPRSTAMPPLGPYPGAPPQMWNNVPISGSPGSLPPPPIFYTTTGGPPTMPNPNFSIHQLLGSPYHPLQGLPRPPSAGPMLNPYAHPPIGAIGSVGPSGSQHSAGYSQGSADSSSASATADKDTIRGMSDVISFIGDT